MYIRNTALLIALGLSAGLVGCHGSDYKPPATQANGVNPPAYPNEVTSSSGGRVGDGAGVAATHHNTSGATTQNPQTPANVPPPSAGTSTPTPAAPFKPGSDQSAPATGGGPKSETSGAVFGDGNQGNTGAVKGGDPSAPSPKQ